MIDAPAPWELRGRAYVSLLRCPPAMLDAQSFVPAALAGHRLPSPLALIMFVDYAASPVGPYHELLFIPGRFAFGDGARHLSISRIYVSSMDSVVNGRRNWGIPKELAQFELRYGDDGEDEVRVASAGHPFATLRYRRRALSLPLGTALLPPAWRTLAQRSDGATYVYRPAARGWMRPARLLEARIDASLFPPVAAAQALLTVQLSEFRMRFAPARVLAGEQGGRAAATEPAC